MSINLSCQRHYRSKNVIYVYFCKKYFFNVTSEKKMFLYYRVSVDCTDNTIIETGGIGLSLKIHQDGCHAQRSFGLKDTVSAMSQGDKLIAVQ